LNHNRLLFFRQAVFGNRSETGLSSRQALVNR